MTPDAFITAYESALATQDWRAVAPLVHSDVFVTFSNGTVHEGIAAVEAAFTPNFSLIQGETYAIANVRWVLKTSETAVYLFDFSWSGVINGEHMSGGGRGTSVLVRVGEQWKLLVEHLGPKA